MDKMDKMSGNGRNAGNDGDNGDDGSSFGRKDAAAALDLLHFEDHSPGQVFWHPAGAALMRRVEDLLLREHVKEGCLEVRSPMLLDRSLWERSGHWDKYQDSMFLASGRGDKGGRNLALRPMSCPGHILIYSGRPRSRRELPLRLFEFGRVFRNESSGSLAGLMRLRAFEQDDSHVFCAADQVGGVVGAFVALIRRVYSAFGFSEPKWRLSLRPEVRAGSDEAWDKAESALRSACAAEGLSPEAAAGEGAFYGPKLEAVLSDGRGREWQCGVVQADFVLPGRFGLSFLNPDGSHEVPVLLHRAAVGSLERWIGVLLEKYGSDLPPWLAFEPVRVLAVGKGGDGDAAAEAAERFAASLRGRGVAAGIDASQSPLKAKIKDALSAGVPILAVIGPKEARNGLVALRGREAGGQEELSEEEAIRRISALASPPL